MTTLLIATIASQAAIVGTVVWTSRAIRRDVARYARDIVKTTHRTQGRCGSSTPTLIGGSPPVFCDLPFGHGGWHKHGDGRSGVATEWTER